MQNLVQKINNRLYYGWVIVAGLFVIGMLGPMSRFGLTSLFPFISADYGWTRSDMGLAQSIALWTYSLCVIGAGWMVDTIGSRKTIFIGGALTLIGWLLFSGVNTLWGFFIIYGVVMGVSTSLTHWVPVLGTARKWFINRAGLVAGILTSASSIGMALFGPLYTLTAASLTWQTTSVACAFLFGILIMLVSVTVIRNTPESVGLRPDGNTKPIDTRTDSTGSLGKSGLKAILRSPQLWLLFISYSLVGIVANALLAHVVVWAVDTNVELAVAGIFITLMQAPSMLTRVFGGWVGDAYGKRRTMMAGAFLSTFVLIAGWLGVSSTVHLVIFVVVLGLSYGPVMVLFSAYVGDLFGRKYVGTLFSLLTLGWGSIGGTGPLIFGIIRDKTGSYNPALLLSAVCFALSFIALALIKPLPQTGTTLAPSNTPPPS